MTNVRDLTTIDLDSIMDIVREKTKITGIDINKYDLLYFKNEISRFLEPYPNKDLGRVIGYFENNELISFLAQQFTERGPMWYMTMLGTKSSHRWNYRLNGLEHCWAYAMARAENAGIYKIVYALPTSWARTQRRTLKTSDVWQKYDLYYDCIIPAGSMPVWPEHKNVFGSIVKEHDVLIKTAILKNEFRPDNIKSQM
jgi:hypothetical protein